MFWGLIMEPKRRYTQVVKRPFHISMAALDLFSADDAPTQVMLYFEDRNYLLCTLQKDETIQCPLDLNFEAGNEVVFATNGNSNIHLSGYLHEELDDLGEEELGEEEEEEEEEVEVEEAINKKKKVKESPNKKEPPTKKPKLAPVLQEELDSKKPKLSSLLQEEFDSDDEDESFQPSDDDVLEEEEDEIEEEEDKSDVSSLSGEDEEEEALKPKEKQVNGEGAKKKNKLQPEEQRTIKSAKKTKNDKSQLAESPKTEGNKKIATAPKLESIPAKEKRTLEGGVIIEELKVGEGAIAKPGKIVHVCYEGKLNRTNKIFDRTSKGATFKFRLGKREVIKGWDIGVAGMKAGGKRRIICPPAMAYGPVGSPPAIPPNSTLVFEVELKNVT